MAVLFPVPEKVQELSRLLKSAAVVVRINLAFRHLWLTTFPKMYFQIRRRNLNKKRAPRLVHNKSKCILVGYAHDCPKPYGHRRHCLPSSHQENHSNKYMVSLSFLERRFHDTETYIIFCKPFNNRKDFQGIVSLEVHSI